jgi:hypothetical protein
MRQMLRELGTPFAGLLRDLEDDARGRRSTG